jgi:tRNA (mo5U34)-methyltransferase
MTAEDDEAAVAPWYHTIDLPSGPTPGEYDLRPTVAKLPFPSTLTGRRCLDVGTHDGFWAFEMERMGAAEVVAIDIEDAAEIDWPEPRPVIPPEVAAFLRGRKARFHDAHAALGSTVEHRYVSVYDLDPSSLGEFDLVHIGSLLQHLRDPVGALMAIRTVTRGELLVSAAIAVGPSIVYRSVPMARISTQVGQPFWTTPNLAGLRRQLESAGFEVVRQGRVHRQPRGAGAAPPRRAAGIPRWRALPGEVLYRRGVPHVGLRARPVRS